MKGTGYIFSAFTMGHATTVVRVKIYHEKIFPRVKFSLSQRKYFCESGAPREEKMETFERCTVHVALCIMHSWVLCLFSHLDCSTRANVPCKRETSNSSDRYAAYCPRMLKPLVPHDSLASSPGSPPRARRVIVDLCTR